MNKKITSPNKGEPETDNIKSVINCYEDGSRRARAIRQQIRQQWCDLWDYRFKDRLAAEDIARKTYDLLYIEKGTVIQATRNYQPPNLSNILKLNEKTLGVQLTYPDPKTGGWHKFSRQVLAEQPRWRNNKMKRKIVRKNEKNALQRKGGRGWLNSKAFVCNEDLCHQSNTNKEKIK